MNFTSTLLERTKQFASEVDSLEFQFTGVIYNPLSYAWEMHKAYLTQYVHEQPEIYFMGMNPGPFGMTQSGVPFGEVNLVKTWMGLSYPIGKPPKEHPKRPILGLETTRSEVSGYRLWSLMKERYTSAHSFFKTHAVMNYCPLVFVDEGPTGKNIIPEKLVKEDRLILDQVCDAYADDMISLIKPKALVGIGRYAERKLEEVTQRLNIDTPVCSILHPSPSNPQANRGWAEKVTAQLIEAHLWE
ncbi:MAG: uracil-DNA glycosylase family protein [Sphaerochaetaceae bacterium]|jgi:single-strand selective monofunctional uracil DNA glycosylase